MVWNIHSQCQSPEGTEHLTSILRPVAVCWRTYCNELSAQIPWFRSAEEKFSFHQMQDEEPHICYTRLEQVDLLEPVCASKKVLIFIADLIWFPTHPILCRNTQYYHPKDLWQRFWQSVFFFLIHFSSFWRSLCSLRFLIKFRLSFYFTILPNLRQSHSQIVF